MNKPIIFENAIERTGDCNKIFDYDYSIDMNVIHIKNKDIPFIHMDMNCHELLSKTAVERERDDEENSFLELSSKTEVSRERDDEELSFVELVSKTFVERERDDEEDINFN